MASGWALGISSTASPLSCAARSRLCPLLSVTGLVIPCPDAGKDYWLQGAECNAAATAGAAGVAGAVHAWLLQQTWWWQRRCWCVFLRSLEGVQRPCGTSVGGLLLLQHSYRRFDQDRGLFRVACRGPMQQMHGPSSQPHIGCTRQLLPYQGCSGCQTNPPRAMLPPVNAWLGRPRTVRGSQAPAPSCTAAFTRVRLAAKHCSACHQRRPELGEWAESDGCDSASCLQGLPALRPVCICSATYVQVRVSAEHGLQGGLPATPFTRVFHMASF